MSKISEQLVKYAQEEKAAAEAYMKDFSTTAIAHLVQGGVEREKANLLAKEACLRNEELKASISKAYILEKVAQYVEALEEDNVKLAAKLDTVVQEEKPVEIDPHLKKLASTGLFTDDEIEAMKDVPSTVLEKVAKSAESADEFGLGRGVGPKYTGPMDDFTKFLMS